MLSYIVLMAKLTLMLAADKRPSDFFTLCSLADPELSACLKKSMIESSAVVMKGIPEMKWPPQDPFFVPRVEMVQGVGNFKLKLALTNLTVTGQKHHKIDDVRVSKDFSRMNITSKVGRIVMDAEYAMSGKIVSVPVTGSGHMRLQIEDVALVGWVHYQHFNKSSDEYFRIDDTKWNIKPGNVNMNFTNLFNGDKALGDATNRLMNENWEEAFETFKDLHEEIYGKVFMEYTNKIITSFPLKEWFKP